MSKYQATERTIDISKVFDRGKTQIPSDVRKIMSLKDGDKIVWKLENGKIVVEVA
jgi:bifunctional DNA-binding transcriptional regulator/antitoxin component of YhaV-PrlF toxin-antitoxin module